MDMGIKRSSTTGKYYVFVAFLIFLSLLATISKIITGVFNDEEYVVAMGLRLLKGDRLFRDMWEVHQTVALFELPFMKVYEHIRGNLDGVYVYLRMINVFMQLIVSIFLYFRLRYKGHHDRIICLISAVVCFNFMPKWSQSFEYAQLFYLFLFLCIISLYCSEKKTDYLIGGIFLSFAIMSYPSACLILPVLLIILYILKKEKKEIILFLAGCILPLVFLLCYVLSEISLPELIRSVPFILSDGHFSGTGKVVRLLKELGKIAVRMAAVMIPSSVLALFLMGKGRIKKEHIMEWLICLWVIGFILVIIVANLVGRKTGPYALNTRYIVMFFSGFYFFKKDGFKNRELFYLFYVLSVVVYAIVVFSSLLGWEVSASYLIPGLIAVMIVMYENMESRQLCMISLFAFTISIIAYKGFFVIVDGTGPANIFDERKRLDISSERGIYIDPSEYDEYMLKYGVIRNETDENDTVVIMTDDPNLNFFTKGRPGGCAMGCYALGYGQQWYDYYTKFDHEKPDVVIIDKDQIPDVERFIATDAFGQWVGLNYTREDNDKEGVLYVMRLKDQAANGL